MSHKLWHSVFETLLYIITVPSIDIHGRVLKIQTHQKFIRHLWIIDNSSVIAHRLKPRRSIVFAAWTSTWKRVENLSSLEEKERKRERERERGEEKEEKREKKRRPWKRYCYHAGWTKDGQRRALSSTLPRFLPGTRNHLSPCSICQAGQWQGHLVKGIFLLPLFLTFWRDERARRKKRSNRLTTHRARMSYFDIRTSYPIRSGPRLFWKQDRTILYLDNTRTDRGSTNLFLPFFSPPLLSHSGSPWFLSSLRFLLPLLPSFSLATFPPEGERGKKPITLDINSAGQSFVGDLLPRRKEGRKHISINVPLRTQHNSGNVRGKVTVVWGGGQQGVAVFRDEKGVEANWTNKVPEGSLRPISR